MPVGSFAPNAWGLYDVHGLLWEYCFDFFADSYADANSDQQSTDFTEYLRIFLAAKRIGSAAHAVGGGVIRVPDSVLDVVHIVR